MTRTLSVCHLCNLFTSPGGAWVRECAHEKSALKLVAVLPTWARSE